ncbi:nucleotidyltransferase family protein [Campylobacter insulaenigrae]|uniref:nucleotidyltransferase family protein n=1 Tax=Campylobacter insulaenigrae TaxID=260714 RepID=UPI002152DD53|nr:nucleotidyltransferase family protein [Campylobacter insulaenigrae]MCR6572386.1 nucleotidyltransferase family protein [Campylobacter insulaenigrae]MCR6573861.1 nucleotidyltransferase family protein [Campylobacter insulaenigrae]MCR6575076.1 nucleotidyltransferase family protein [Campylobacter insulaenigrae]MCR6577414.1 nucleotidyltransferase family protein [Campylobacter insulaenigrae]MCR6580612.1 nucleotidyltransferase family protein [Campylobacter insulaenigrae]
MNINNLKLTENSSIKQALQTIGKLRVRLALVVDENDNFLGVISDSNIRKALINDYKLEDSIKKIYTKNPVVVQEDCDEKTLLNLSAKYDIYDFPVLDKNKKVIAIKSIASMLHKEKNKNNVILMAGGLGTRLKELTKNTPKPMLKVGNKPILESIITKFKEQNFENFIFCVNYKKQVIEKYFKNGDKFDVNIKYIKEKKRLGTAGALSLIKDEFKDSFIVMNADILTELDFNKLLKAHKKSKALMSVCLREFIYQNPYGVVELSKNYIKDIKEKPVQKFLVSAGIYVCEPYVLKFLRENEYLDMPDFIKLLMKENKINTFLIDDYWIDIGQIDEFKKANEEFK